MKVTSSKKTQMEMKLAPTFQNLTNVDTSICKHDAEGYCHDAHQDTKHGFKVTHAKPVYQ